MSFAMCISLTKTLSLFCGYGTDESGAKGGLHASPFLPREGRATHLIGTRYSLLLGSERFNCCSEAAVWAERSICTNSLR